METLSPSLADRLGSLRATAGAESACGWVPAALHALIMACLARIFGRLEQVILLWQSGDLPLPLTARPQDDSSSRVRTGLSGQWANQSGPRAPWSAVRGDYPDMRTEPPAPKNRPRIRARGTRKCMPRAAPAVPAPNRPAASVPSGPARGTGRLRSARDPPPNLSQNAAFWKNRSMY